VTPAFHAILGSSPSWTWFAPGRIELFGKHTDYAGGQSLVAAVSRGFLIEAAPRDDGMVRVIDAAGSSAVELDPAVEAPPFTGWRNYVAVVARRLAKNFPGAPLGADIVFASSLPRAAGVSSSSALVVGVASALIERANLSSRPEWTAAIQSPLDLAGYLGAVENGLTFAALAGTAGVGTHGGSEDHTAIIASRADHVGAFAYIPVREVGRAPMPAGWRFVILSSGVHAAKAGGVRDRYNRASLATRALLAIWNAHAATPAPTLASALAGNAERTDHLRRWLPAQGHDQFSQADLARRLDHFVRENARVPRALAAFESADATALGELARASQEDADWLLGNQVPRTRELVRAAIVTGARAASSFGAGFGGSAWALTDAGPDEAERLLAAWRRAYLRACPDMAGAEGFVTGAEAGLSRR